LSTAGTPTSRDRRRIRGLAIASLIALAAVAWAWLVIPPAVAPRINVRWADGVSDAQRLQLESRLQLYAGEQRDGATWAYDLGDPSWRGVRRLIADPAVADTHHVNRRFRIIASDAPAGTTRLSGGALSRWRDSAMRVWVVRLSLSFLFVSVCWLFVTREPTRAGVRGGRL
jgi:hypothetical protein